MAVTCASRPCREKEKSGGKRRSKIAIGKCLYLQVLLTWKGGRGVVCPIGRSRSMLGKESGGELTSKRGGEQNIMLWRCVQVVRAATPYALQVRDTCLATVIRL